MMRQVAVGLAAAVVISVTAMADSVASARPVLIANVPDSPKTPDAGGNGGGCDDWGCGSNSPVVDGATIAEPTALTPAR